MNQKLSGFYNIIFISLAICYLGKSLFPFVLLEYLFSFLTVLVFISALSNVSGPSRVYSYLLLLIGVILMWETEVSPLDILSSLNNTSKLISLYVLVPLIGIIINIGGYQNTFGFVLKKYASKKIRLYCVASIINYILALVLNMGAHYIVYHLTRPEGENIPIIGKAITRGSSSAMYWAPSMMAVSVVLSLSHISWVNILPYAIVLSFIGLTIGCFTEFISLVIKEGNMGSVDLIDHQYDFSHQKFIQLIGMIVLIIISVLFVLAYTDLNIIAGISLVACLVSFSWAFFLKKMNDFFSEIQGYGCGVFQRYKNEASIFMCAGFFGVAIEKSGYGKLIPEILRLISGNSSVKFIFAILILFLLINLIGIHPMVPVVALLSSVDPNSFALTKECFALICLAGWSIGASVSPLSANNIIAAGILEVSPFKIAYRWNAVYAILNVLILTFIISRMSIFI